VYIYSEAVSPYPIFYSLPCKSIEAISVSKVMVVDENEVIRRLVSKILREDGYEVVDFPDAAPALEEADLDAIELILTDLNRPTPGEKLIQEVRKKNAKTPIVVMSGHLTEERLKLLEELGAVVLEKPFALSVLLQTIQTHTSSLEVSDSV